jgi:hypothetical protein
MQMVYGFEIVNANRLPQMIAQELSAKIARVLNLQPVHPEPISVPP